jgi:hypothetical protein
MARADAPTSLHDIRNASSLGEQVAALERLKNALVGHDQRKELAVRHGLVGDLVRNLKGTGTAMGKRRSGGARSGHDELELELELEQGLEHDEDEVRLQSIVIVTSLAQGTCAYHVGRIVSSHQAVSGNTHQCYRRPLARASPRRWRCYPTPPLHTLACNGAAAGDC